MKSENRNVAGLEGWKSFLKLAAGILLIVLLYLSGIEKVPESAVSRAENGPVSKTICRTLFT